MPGLSEFHQIRAHTRIRKVMYEAILQRTVFREEHTHHLTIPYNILLHPDEVQKAAQDIHRVPIIIHLQETDLLHLTAADLITADLLVQALVVPILQDPHLVHPLVHPPGLHRAGDSIKR